MDEICRHETPLTSNLLSCLTLDNHCRLAMLWLEKEKDFERVFFLKNARSFDCYFHSVPFLVNILFELWLCLFVTCTLNLMFRGNTDSAVQIT